MIVPNDNNVGSRLDMINELKSFLLTAPDNQQEHINRHHLPSGEIISSVKWDDTFYITGTDIVRCLVFRFQAFGRPVENVKKFEEGVFSDLRNLKPGTDAILEEPKSPFLDLLFRNNCIRTQKKQKVFYWFSVPHDRLFLDALERDLKREKMGVEPTSTAVAQPAVAISLDTTQAMFDEFRKAMLCELNLEPFYQKRELASETHSVVSDQEEDSVREPKASPITVFGQFSLFEGSPTYKQRRRRVTGQMHPADNSSSNLRKRSPMSLTASSPTSTTSNSSNKQCHNASTADDEENTMTRHFDCPLSSCGKVFKRLEHMKRHLRTHTLERPYLCDLCGKRFSRSDNLAQHKKTHDRANNNNKGDDLRNHSNEQVPRRYHRQQQRSSAVRANSSSSGRRRNTKPYPGANTGSDNSFVNRITGVTTRRARSRRAQYNSRRLSDATIETDALYGTDWTSNFDNDVSTSKEDAMQPTLSNSTSSTDSSCESSPVYNCHKLPTIKLEDIDLCYDLSYQQQDTTMMMVEELLPQEEDHQQQQAQQQSCYAWEDMNSASDWQRRIDWDQYAAAEALPPSPPLATATTLYDVYQQQQPNEEGEEAYTADVYLHLASSSQNYAAPTNSNASSCLASPMPAFLMTPTYTHQSVVTTATNSPIIMDEDFYCNPQEYYPDESPTMTPTDALLQF